MDEKNVEMEKNHKKKTDFLKLTVYTAVFGLMGGVSFYGLSQLATKKEPSAYESQSKQQANENGIMQTSVISGSAIGGSGTSNVSAVAKQVLPSIVQIQVTSSQTVTDMFGRDHEQEGSGSGSGIIIGQNDKQVLIATNNHVVNNSKSVTIQFSDNQKVAAMVKGTDSNADLAVVAVDTSKISKDTLGKIKVATLGDSKSLEVGEQAIAIGNALGYGTSVTVGYISALDRKVTFEDGSMKLIQTDAAINPGNSGGALVNNKGQVIGINSAKFASEEVEGMGFAIPISTAIPIINELMNKEAIPENEQAYLGIQGSDVTKEYTSYYGIPTGVYISDVTAGSPADQAGLQKGQVITKINNKAITTTQGLQEALSTYRAGEKGSITIQVSTDGNQYTQKVVEVTFGSKSKS